MRSHADIDDDTRNQGKQYADERGLNLSRPYRDLIEAGLNAEQE